MPKNYLLAAKGDPKKPTTNQTDNQKFGNWTGQDDSRLMAADLMKRGMVGANQLLYENQNTSTPEAVRGNQSSWKLAAIQNILAKAKELNIRRPEEVSLNKNVLMSTLDPKYRDAINSPSFNITHPNFWQTISTSILPEQYAKFDKSNNLLAKK